MIARVASLRRLARDEDGATLVEFALILLPMCILLMGGMEVAYTSMVRATMQGALNDAARRAAVENPDFSQYEGDTLEDRIEQSVREIVGTMASDATVDVRQRSFFEFSNIGNPEKLLKDVNRNGRYDAADGDCFEDANDNGSYDTDTGEIGGGGANDVVFYEATVTKPRLFPLHRLVGAGEEMEIHLQTAVRNQPYASRGTPSVLCGLD